MGIVIDVSNYQGDNIDWSYVAAHNPAVIGVVCKTSEGTWFADPTLPHNWNGVKAAGLARLAYHFGRADRQTDPHAEAAFFKQQVGGAWDTGDIAILDSEVGIGNISWWDLAFLADVYNWAGNKPWVYTGGWFTPNHLTDPALSAYPLWDSAYQQFKPAAPFPWHDSQFVLWQYTETGVIDGINGHVDLSIFDGTKEQLMAYGKPAPKPPVQYPTGPVYVVKVDHFLRKAPASDAPHGTEVLVGERLLASHNQEPHTVDWTTDWRYVWTSYGSGYAYAPNLELAK